MPGLMRIYVFCSLFVLFLFHLHLCSSLNFGQRAVTSDTKFVITGSEGVYFSVELLFQGTVEECIFLHFGKVLLFGCS